MSGRIASIPDESNSAKKGQHEMWTRAQKIWGDCKSKCLSRHSRLFGKPDGGAVTFKEVLAAEKAEINELRRRRKADKEGALVGLAFSGGGIRSATFNLGVLQGLASFRLLRRVDYISSVSGGGYISSWLISWIKRAGLGKVERQLASAPPPPASRGGRGSYREPGPINFLREYSNYLTPRVGLFGADTWAAIATYLRNFLLNLTMLVACLSVLLLVPRLMQVLFAARTSQPSHGVWVAQYLTITLLLLALYFVNINVADFSFRECAQVRMELGPKFTSQRWVLITIIFPIMVTAFTGAWLLWYFAVYCVIQSPLWHWVLVGCIGYGSLRLVTFVLAFVFSHIAKQERSCVRRTELRSGLLVSFTAFAAGGLGGYLLYWFAKLFQFWASAFHLPIEGRSLILVFGPPLMILALLLTGVLHLGLMGLWFENQRGEWWARAAGWLMLGAIGWLLLAGLSLFAPLWILSSAPLVRAKIIPLASWLGSTLFGVLAGRSDKTSGKEESNRILDLAAAVMPYIFVAGLLVVLSWGVSTVVPLSLQANNARSASCAGAATAPAVAAAGHAALAINSEPVRTDVKSWTVAAPQAKVDESFTTSKTGRIWLWMGMLVATPNTTDHQSPVATYWHTWSVGPKESFSAPMMICGIVGWILFLIVVTSVLALRVDINEFSMNLLYRNRLVRCYLGASNLTRDAQRFTGFDPEDDQLLASFSTDVDKRYSGPYPIINTALNLTHGERLAWQERQAESFVFTPRYSGFQFQEEHQMRQDAPAASGLGSGGFRETREYAYPPARGGLGGAYLGTALAISGAAASPNMGYHTSPPLAFLMTIFNVRLGWWMGNPRSKKWGRATPRVSLLYLLEELFASTDDRSDYVYLSDGGHFENLGIYELVRRHCSLIIACDGDADSKLTFGDLGNAIRKCRSDFGVEIDLSVDEIIPKKDAPFSNRHFAVGNIYYPDGGEPSKLIYLKASLTGKEPRDVLAYKAEHSSFPHETTVDQWFDESQFESYRTLGRFAVEDALKRFGWSDTQRRYVKSLTVAEILAALDLAH